MAGIGDMFHGLAAWYKALPTWGKIAAPVAAGGVVLLIWRPWSASSESGVLTESGAAIGGGGGAVAEGGPPASYASPPAPSSVPSGGSASGSFGSETSGSGGSTSGSSGSGSGGGGGGRGGGGKTQPTYTFNQGGRTVIGPTYMGNPKGSGLYAAVPGRSPVATSGSYLIYRTRSGQVVSSLIPPRSGVAALVQRPIIGAPGGVRPVVVRFFRFGGPTPTVPARPQQTAPKVSLPPEVARAVVASGIAPASEIEPVVKAPTVKPRVQTAMMSPPPQEMRALEMAHAGVVR